MSKDNKKSKYVKLSHREHVLKRPDTYIGSVVSDEEELYVVDSLDLDDELKISKQKVINNKGFIKIFDEILTNASDSSIRTDKVKFIKVVIEDDKISVENDGPTVPIEIHPTENIYIAELIFSNLLSGESFDDSKTRKSANRNGLGSKLTNIFSKKFKVECCDGKTLYRQWTKDHMKNIEEPSLNKVSGEKSFTRITYYPDYDLFDLKGLTDDLKKIMYKRCLDIAAYLPHVRISLSINGKTKTLPIKKSSDYMKMHLEEDADFFYEELDNGWCVGIAKSSERGFEHNTIINSTSTSRGSTATNYIALQLAKDIADKFPKKVKTNWTDVKNKLFLFLIAEVPNPTFDTQTKEYLTNNMTNEITGGCSVSEKTVKKIMKSDIVKSILEEIEMKQKLQLKKMGGGKKNKVNMPKLVDANKAGTKDSEKCSLFLTEGDCLHEDTEVFVFRDGEKKNILIKDIKIDDLVISHNSNILSINAISKKIEKSVKINLKNGDTLICSENHKWYVYDKVFDKFKFIETKSLDINKHKMIINKNVNFNNLIEIVDIIEEKNDKYDKVIITSSDKIYSTNEHKFSILDMDSGKFDMVKCEDLDINNHYIVNYDKI